MRKLRLQKWITALLTAATCMILLATMASAMGAYSPVMQQLRAKEVKGSVGAGQSVWLGLTPETSGATVTILAEFDRNNPTNNGVNFYLLDESGLRRVGDGPLSSIALGAGSANFVLNGPDNVVGASFNAVGLAQYTIVLQNESGTVANFTLKATNGFILDDSKQVTDPNAAPASTPVTSTTTTATTATTSTTTAAPTAQPTQAPTPIATKAATTATVVTTTTTTSATTPATTAAPGKPVVVRAATLSGDLPKQNDQHYLGLEPSARDAQITLRLTIDPQDSSELQRRLNFWVVDETGFKQVTNGADPSDVAIAAGNRAFRTDNNERVASFKAAGIGNYTVIVYNNATIPGSYALAIEGGLLVDDSNQTKEAAKLASTAPAVSATTTTTTTTGATTAAPAPVAAGSTVTPTARVAQPGGTYTIKSGDTLALLARDIYGDYRLYEQICAFNSLSNCDLVEVGDVIRLPTRAQIQAGITAPAPKPTQAAPKPTTTTTVTPTVPTTSTATTARPVSTTTTVTPTATTTSTTSTGAQTSAPANRNIYQTLAANNNFSDLTQALKSTGLDALLSGPGPYTIFAPTDAAFTALRTQFKLTEAQLLGLPELADTLKYHVLSGTTLSDDISNGLQATTAQGKAVRFEVSGSTIKVNGATLVATNIETSNGVIHAIDAVIIPPAD